ncbi:MAG TPA: hypothetical protein VJ965_01730 [Anaerolineales bacterium]|nr:hypothetical protein [Anaerolineales bacterium]
MPEVTMRVSFPHKLEPSKDSGLTVRAKTFQDRIVLKKGCIRKTRAFTGSPLETCGDDTITDWEYHPDPNVISVKNDRVSFPHKREPSKNSILAVPFGNFGDVIVQEKSLSGR